MAVLYLSTSSATLLGVEISDDLSWTAHIQSIAAKASRKLGFLFRARSYFSSKDLLQLYKAQVRPLMEYCSHIWSAAPDSCLSILDKIQACSIRFIAYAEPNLLLVF